MLKVIKEFKAVVMEGSALFKMRILDSVSRYIVCVSNKLKKSLGYE